MAKADLTPEQIADKAARKAEKKARKALESAATSTATSTADNTDAEMSAATPVAASEEDDKARAKREKKEAKKAEKKRRREQEESASATPVADVGTETAVNGDGERKSKKAKKNGSHQNGNDTPASAASTTASTPAPVASTSAATAAPAPSSAEVEAFLKENNISYDPESTSQELPPVLSFAALPLDDGVRKGLSGFAKPTPIQSASFPLMLAGRDVIGIAETGYVALCCVSLRQSARTGLSRD